MTTYLPKDVQETLAASCKGGAKPQNHLWLRAGGEKVPILRLWEGGFSLDADGAPILPGLVDLYDGSRHLCQCLVVALGREAGEMRFEFKRSTAVAKHPPKDFADPPSAPLALPPGE